MKLRCRTCGTQVDDHSTTEAGRDDLGDIIWICTDCSDTHRLRWALGDNEPPHPRMEPRL